MVKLHYTYDSTVLEYDPLPAGKYRAMLIESKDNAKGTGLTFQFSVIGGDYDGRKLFLNLPTNSTNPGAHIIVTKFMNPMLMGVGKGTIDDTSELEGIVYVLTVGINKDDQSRNEIKKISLDDPGAIKHQAVTTAPAQATAPARPAAPWKR